MERVKIERGEDSKRGIGGDRWMNSPGSEAVRNDAIWVEAGLWLLKEEGEQQENGRLFGGFKKRGHGGLQGRLYTVHAVL